MPRRPLQLLQRTKHRREGCPREYIIAPPCLELPSSPSSACIQKHQRPTTVVLAFFFSVIPSFVQENNADICTTALDYKMARSLAPKASIYLCAVQQLTITLSPNPSPDTKQHGGNCGNPEGVYAYSSSAVRAHRGAYVCSKVVPGRERGSGRSDSICSDHH